MDGGLQFRATHTLHCPGFSVGCGLLHYKPVRFLRRQDNCHVNERLAGLHEPCVLVEVTSSEQPFAVLTERPLQPSPPTVVVLMFNSLIRKGSGCFS